MNDKIVVITGANSGIGKETGKVLAQMGATIIMICRNRERGEEALQEIKEKSQSENVELIIADLEDPESIRQAVIQFKGKYDKLHVLINNAGLMLNKKELTSLGYEKTFAINHLGHFFLTKLLLDILLKSAPARIINVSSEAHRYANLKLDDINMKKYKGFRAYSNSKLANILYTYELARRLEGTGITVNALHPGFVKTNFGNHGVKKYLKPFYKFITLFAMNVEKGAKTSIYLASSSEVENITGKYFIKSKSVKSSEISYNLELQKKLWQISEGIFAETDIKLIHSTT
ncbi:MAG: SDR family oxidoreductase [Candidatus Thorarchaeota archaeon]